MNIGNSNYKKNSVLKATFRWYIHIWIKEWTVSVTEYCKQTVKNYFDSNLLLPRCAFVSFGHLVNNYVSLFLLLFRNFYFKQGTNCVNCSCNIRLYSVHFCYRCKYFVLEVEVSYCIHVLLSIKCARKKKT